MSIFQDIYNFPQRLNQKYHRTDMAEILDKYCQEIASLPQTNVKEFVLDSDKERYEKQINDLGKPVTFILNSGHIYTALICDDKHFNRFEKWFKENYKTNDK